MRSTTGGRPDVRRNTAPVAPECSALADELRKSLKGKPTRSGFNRSLFRELLAFAGDLVKIALVFVLCFVFIFGGFGAGMLLGYVSSTKPLSISDLTQTEEVQTSFVYDSQGNVISKLTGNENVDRIYVPFGVVRDTYIDEAIISIEDERYYSHNGIDIKGIISIVSVRSLILSISRAAIIAGTLHPKPTNMGIKLRPCRPTACMILSIRKAARAI